MKVNIDERNIMNLFEAYKNRLSIAESVYSKANGGAKLDYNR